MTTARETAREFFYPLRVPRESGKGREASQNPGNQEREQLTARAVAASYYYYYYCYVTVRNVRSCLADTNVTVRNVPSPEVVR